MNSIYGAVPMEKLKERIHFAELAPKVIDLIPADRTELFHRVELPGSDEPGSEDGKEPQRVMTMNPALCHWESILLCMQSISPSGLHERA